MAFDIAINREWPTKTNVPQEYSKYSSVFFKLPINKLADENVGRDAKRNCLVPYKYSLLLLILGHWAIAYLEVTKNILITTWLRSFHKKGE